MGVERGRRRNGCFHSREPVDFAPRHRKGAFVSGIHTDTPYCTPCLRRILRTSTVPHIASRKSLTLNISSIISPKKLPNQNLSRLQPSKLSQPGEIWIQVQVSQSSGYLLKLSGRGLLSLAHKDLAVLHHCLIKLDGELSELGHNFEYVDSRGSYLRLYAVQV